MYIRYKYCYLRENRERVNIFLVLIGLVIIFKSQLTDLVESIFTKITKQAGTI